jgi:hypothetical protein
MNEFKHKSAGLGLESDAEYTQIDGHEADGQTLGDTLYYNGTYWIRRPYLLTGTSLPGSGVDGELYVKTDDKTVHVWINE